MAPEIMNAFLQLEDIAIAGSVAAANTPPSGIPVCLTPMAVALPLIENQDMTAFPVAGLMVACPIPAKSRNPQIIGNESAKEIDRINNPMIS